jgi:hypothetical protein
MSALGYRGPSLTTLHEQYAKQHRIDDAAPVRARANVTIDAPATEVWDKLVDVAAWRTNLEPDVRNTSVPSGVTVDAAFSRTIKGARLHATFAVVDHGRELAWTGRSLGIKVVHRYTLDAVSDSRTRVMVDESMAGPPMIALINSVKLESQLGRSLALLRSVSERTTLR